MATKQFRANMIVLLGVFGVISVVVAWGLAQSLRLTVEDASPSPASDLPAISDKGAQLRPADGEVVPADAGCEALITWDEGDCGVEADLVWVSERRLASTLETDEHRVRVFTLNDGGWVERLRADDLDEPRWMDVRVAARDLTGDGESELLVSYRYFGSGQDLGTDVVYADDGVPTVAHLDDAVRGSVVLQDGDVIQYRAKPAPGDANCCPSVFERRTIAWQDGAFRVVSTDTVEPGQVPASDL